MEDIVKNPPALLLQLRTCGLRCWEGRGLYTLAASLFRGCLSYRVPSKDHILSWGNLYPITDACEDIYNMLDDLGPTRDILNNHSIPEPSMGRLEVVFEPVLHSDQLLSLLKTAFFPSLPGVLIPKALLRNLHAELGYRVCFSKLWIQENSNYERERPR